MRQRRCASIAPAVATATAKECGCTVLIRLVRSITPSTRAGVGVVHRGGRARPRLHDLVEVLGGEHLHRVVGGQRGADRVRARAALAPQRPDREVHRVRGREPDARRALEPQQRPVGIADHHQVRGVVGDPGEALADERRDRHERVDLPARRDLVVVGDRRRGAARASDRRRPRTSAARSRRSGGARTPAGRPRGSAPRHGEPPARAARGRLWHRSPARDCAIDFPWVVPVDSSPARATVAPRGPQDNRCSAVAAPRRYKRWRGRRSVPGGARRDGGARRWVD